MWCAQNNFAESGGGIKKLKDWEMLIDLKKICVCDYDRRQI